MLAIPLGDLILDHQNKIAVSYYHFEQQRQCPQATPTGLMQLISRASNPKHCLQILRDQYKLILSYLSKELFLAMQNKRMVIFLFIELSDILLLIFSFFFLQSLSEKVISLSGAD